MPEQVITTGARTGLSIPDYELLRPIGRGAYGEVWLARNVTGSWVALKIVHRAAFDHDRPFEREFEGIKRFEPISRSDPSQVAILHVGLGEGFFYYVMELADQAGGAEEKRSGGEKGKSPPAPFPLCSSAPLPPFSPANYAPLTLKRLLNDRGALPAQECLAIAISLTRALTHLHGHGLVHRDVKPSNVIFVNGQAKLADIGLVTSVDATRSFVGTEGYLPPEGAGTPQADLYSLGKMLYEMSTGCDRKEFPALPPDIATRPDRETIAELNAIVVRACQLDPRERYACAEAMQADLALLQRGKSVKEQYVWRKRLHAARRSGLAAAAVVLAMAGIAFLWQTINHHYAPVILTVNEDGSAGTRNPEAAKAFRFGFRGLRQGTQKGFNAALEGFTAATKADPLFLAAHARLFETYLMSEDYDIDYNDKRKPEYLEKLSVNMVKLSRTNAESHAALAIVHFLNHYEWDAAEDEFKEALKADPKCRMALVYYGYFLTRQRRADEARKILKYALEIDSDPESPLITKFLGHCDFVQRHYNEAFQYYDKASKDPSYPGGHYWAGRVYLAITNYEAALDEFEKHEVEQGLSFASTRAHYDDLRKALRKDGPPGYWLKQLETVNAQKDQAPYWYAECHARAGHRTEALAGLQAALLKHDTLTEVLVDEFWDDYRNDPKFKEVLKGVGLDKWAR